MALWLFNGQLLLKLTHTKHYSSHRQRFLHRSWVYSSHLQQPERCTSLDLTTLLHTLAHCAADNSRKAYTCTLHKQTSQLRPVALNTSTRGDFSPENPTQRCHRDGYVQMYKSQSLWPHMRHFKSRLRSLINLWLQYLVCRRLSVCLSVCYHVFVNCAH